MMAEWSGMTASSTKISKQWAWGGWTWVQGSIPRVRDGATVGIVEVGGSAEMGSGSGSGSGGPMYLLLQYGVYSPLP